MQSSVGGGSPSAYLLFLLSFTLRLLTLDTQSLWWDEGISLHLATSPWREIITDRAANIHPPLYFFALKLWVSVAGRTPFAARYPSALATALLPLATHRFLRRRADRRTARAAALLVALATPFLIYGQEVRAYAFLPLLALLLLAQLWRRRPLATWRDALCLALIQTAWLLTHYVGAIAAVWSQLFLLIHLLRGKNRRAAWWQWAFTVGLTLLLLSPWIGAVLAAHAVGFRREAGLGNALARPIPMNYLLRMVGLFHLVGLPQALADPGLTRPVALVGLLALFALMWAVMRRAVPRATLTLLAVWLLPLTAVPIIWGASPQAHPRYLLPFILPAWMLIARLITAPRLPRPLRRLLLAAVLTVNLLGTRAYLTDPTYARSDVRAVAAHLRREAVAGDVILVPHTDWSLPQYGTGAARVVMLPSSADDAAVAATLGCALRGAAHIYTLDYGRGGLDPRGQVRATLLSRAYLDGQWRFTGGPRLERYSSLPAVDFPSFHATLSLCAGDRSPCLVGVALADSPVSGNALPVALRWRGGPAEAPLAVALRLHDQGGALVAQGDALLLDARQQPTDRWTGELVTTYHHIPLPVGLLPRPYTLTVSLYRADDPARAPIPLTHAEAPAAPAVPVGTVQPRLAPWLEPSPYGLPSGPFSPTLTVAPILRLEGAAADRAFAAPGQTFFVTLRWRMVQTATLPQDYTVRLRQGERFLAEEPLFVGVGEHPIPVGRPLLEQIPLTVPAEAADGPAALRLRAAGQTFPLGEVTLAVGERTFVVPPLAHAVGQRVGDVATLLGFDLTPVTPRSGHPFTLTLIWRAEAGAADTQLTVFTHLLGEGGAIVAQHDGPPVEGTRPTGGWLTGEILTDVHRLTWLRPYSGPAQLCVGLYNPTTGARVRWEEGRDVFCIVPSLTVISP